jgi:hypothetical protein
VELPLQTRRTRQIRQVQIPQRTRNNFIDAIRIEEREQFPLFLFVLQILQKRATVVAMKHVGVREFKDRATTLLAADETFIVKRHDEPIGLYIPLKTKTASEKKKILDGLQKSVTKVLKETGLTEDELVEALRIDKHETRR